MAESRGPGGQGGGFLSRWSQRKAEVRKAEVRQEPRVDPPSDPPRDDPAAVPAPSMPPLMPSRPVLSISPATKFAAVGAPAAATGAGAPQALPLVELHSSALPSQPTLDGAKAEAEFLPTLDDVAKLEPGANVAGFVGRNVAPEVRNAAVKKLFADPHFNVMDGLDVYIDDYNKTEPLPRQWLRQMMQARVLGLLDDEVQDQDLPTPDDPPDRVPDDVPGEVLVDPPVALAEDSSEPPLDLQSEARPVAHREPLAENPPPHEDTHLPLQPDDAAGRDGTEEGAGGPRPVKG